LDTRLLTLLCKKITVAKSKEVKTGYNLAESSKKGYGSKRAVLPLMMMIMLKCSRTENHKFQTEIQQVA
jgi:hypothetical protein